MDVKLVLVVIFAFFALHDVVLADFWYNHVTPKREELNLLGMICIPGRTIIKMKEKPVEQDHDGDGLSDEEDRRRSHMRFSTEDESCQVCVCSVEAKDEYCSNRPAMNVNECMRMAVVMSKFQRNEPFDHERTLSYMIRRDLIWHDDEIPSPPKARCKRGRSYYSNSANANDTDLDLPSDVDSILNYPNKEICWYCVCSTSGHYSGCIHRNPWYCQFYRDLRMPDAARYRYKSIFQQDRPAYFRQLSWRLRRTMDNGMFDFIENGGDSLCCGHADGHRRLMHHQVRNKIKMMTKAMRKENLLNGAPAGDYEDFVVNND